MKNVISLCLLCLLLGCQNENTVYNETASDFPQHLWKKDKTLTFQFPINDTTSKYNLILSFRHVYGFRMATLPLLLQMTSPLSKKEQIQINMVVRKDTEYLSKCSGDICDLETVIRSDVKFETTGQYKLEINNTEDLYDVMEVGLRVEKNTLAE